MDISTWPRDEKSEHAMELKIITKAQIVSFPKDQDQKHDDHIF
jgi:hypothetical protein